MSNLSEVSKFKKPYKYEVIAVHIIPEKTFTLHNVHFTSFITISQHLEFKVKIQNDTNKQITTTTESSVP